MTEKEIKDLAFQYVKATTDPQYKSPDLALEIRAREREITSFLSFLTDRFCLTEKSKVKEWQGILEDTLSEDAYVTAPAMEFMWERLFGSEYKINR